MLFLSYWNALQANGASYSKVEDWHPYAVEDGLLITGQNPASSKLVAEKLLKPIKRNKHVKLRII
jgi:putative intracellular protease/amidase